MIELDVGSDCETSWVFIYEMGYYGEGLYLSQCLSRKDALKAASKELKRLQKEISKLLKDCGE